MILFLISLLAGILTVLAPCTISLLPVIVGGSLSGGTSFRRVVVVTTSLGVSVILFTLLLKVSTTLVNIPQTFWQEFSGTIIIFLGITMIFPKLLDKIPGLNTLNRNSTNLVSAGYKKQNFFGDVLVGMALGPVFSSCSPTYFLILATVLPKSIPAGIIYLLAYTFGLCVTLLLVAVVGQRIMNFLGVASDPNGVIKKSIGVLFLLVGCVIFSGYDKTLELYVAKNVFDVTKIEQLLLPSISTQGVSKSKNYVLAPEITNPSGYVNTNGQPITLSMFKNKKVVLVDFWTYSCINCQRTLPYLKDWYEKYHDKGLEIVGIHTPEFAFEKVKSNVEAFVKKDGLKWPMVLDNDYGTWNAFGNQFWPHKYLINQDGYIIYDHAGEGNYIETEMEIQKALGITNEVSNIQPVNVDTNSPETYFGYNRNEYLGNGNIGQSGVSTFALLATTKTNKLYLGGNWDIKSEYAESLANSSIVYKYSAKGVYFVAGANTENKVEVQVDDKPVPENMKGADIFYENEKSYIKVKDNRLYKLIDNKTAQTHTLKLIMKNPGLQAFAFTFG